MSDFTKTLGITLGKEILSYTPVVGTVIQARDAVNTVIEIHSAWVHSGGNFSVAASDYIKSSVPEAVIYPSILKSYLKSEDSWESRKGNALIWSVICLIGLVTLVIGHLTKKPVVCAIGGLIATGSGAIALSYGAALLYHAATT